MTKRILLLGENGLDLWINGECKKLSPEAPVPVFTPHRTDKNLGMAGNVKENLTSLSPGTKIDFFHQSNAIYKIRYVDEISGQQLLRVDEYDDAFEPNYWTNIVDGMSVNKDGYKACIISDYGKGLVTEKVIEAITEIMNELKVPVFLDTKKMLGTWSKNVDFVKINNKEYNAQISSGIKDPWNWCRNLIVTRGKDGSVLYDNDGSVKYVAPAYSKDVSCVSGAGDSFHAALVVKYLENGNDVNDAINYANHVAAIAVSKRGVVAVRREEVEIL